MDGGGRLWPAELEGDEIVAQGDVLHELAIRAGEVVEELRLPHARAFCCLVPAALDPTRVLMPGKGAKNPPKKCRFFYDGPESRCGEAW